MEDFKLSKTDTGVHIEGFPDAKKVIALKGPVARQIADYGLHKVDLEFVLNCLDEINLVPLLVARDAMWLAAVVRFVKCFVGGSARIRLDGKVIYGKNQLALDAFAYFKELRDKHIAHDESAYSQSMPCAAINGGDKTYKVEKIFTLPLTAVSLDQGNYNNLHTLASDALAWVKKRFDELCDRVTAELETCSYDDLINRPAVTFTVPAKEDVAKAKQANVFSVAPK